MLIFTHFVYCKYKSMKLISFVYSHCVVFVSIRFQLGRRRINFLVSFQQNCSIWTRAEVAVDETPRPFGLPVTAKNVKNVKKVEISKFLIFQGQIGLSPCRTT